jgi:transposase-like protein
MDDLMSVNEGVYRCPYCHTESGQVKAGRNISGSQRIKCRKCGKKYTPTPSTGRYGDEIRAEAVRLYLNGVSFRSVAKKLGVNHQSVINWVNEYAAQLPRPIARSLSRR